MLRRVFIGCLLLVLALGGPPPARAETVDLALVLVADVSGSIDDSEFELQKQGYAAAFRDPKVVAAIQSGASGAIAVSYIEFAGADQVRRVLDWTVIRDDATAGTFADRFEKAPRSFRGHTSISAGIDAAVENFAESGVTAARRAIDVSGDGTNNSGRAVADARDAAIAEGIIINGLAIINDHPVSYLHAHVQPPGGLTEWYRQNVIGGPGSFVLEVHDFHTFGEAMTQKLVAEIASLDLPSRRAPL
jgi:hypothetical protein